MPAQSIWTLLSWGPDGWSDDIASGVLVTIVLALATLPLGLVIGFFVAFAKQHEERRCGWPATFTPPSFAACRNW